MTIYKNNMPQANWNLCTRQRGNNMPQTNWKQSGYNPSRQARTNL